MAKSTVEIEFSSRDEQVTRTLQKVERGFDQLARKLDKVEAASKKSTDVSSKGFEKVAGAITRTATAIIGGGGLLTGIDMLKRSTEEAIQKAEEAAHKYDDLFRGFRVQAGLTELEGKAAQENILRVAEANAVAADVAKAGAGGLVSAGFNVKDATGGALNALLKTQSAFVAAGKPVDTQNLAKQIAAYFASQGEASTAGNVQRAMEEAFALRAGAFELSDFAELGKQGAVFKGKLSRKEQLAAFGTLVDVMPSAEAATTMRNMVLKLTAGGRTTKDALGQLGLAPGDVDLIGENFGTALDRISGGLAGIPEQDRAPVLKKLFEEAGVAGASVLLNERRGKYARYQRGMLTSAAEFNQSAQIAQQGINAAQIRQQVRAEARAAETYDQGDLYLQALDEQAVQAGMSPARRFFARQSYNTYRAFGMTPETAAGLVYNYHNPFSDVNARGDALRQTAQQQLQGDINGGQPVKVEVVNQAKAPPKAVPSKAIDRRGLR